MDVSKITVVGAIAIATFVFLFALGIYRVYLSPLAVFPGPKLAALTQWYETYYELFKEPRGQFMFHYRKLHERYGPIIRVNPHEVHIQDSRFFHVLYSQKLSWDKPQHLQHRFGNSKGLGPTPHHETHRLRRAALNPLFSKRAVLDFSPFLQAQVNKLCNRLDCEYKAAGNVLRLDWMFASYAADAVVAYCLENKYQWLETPDFHCDFAEAMNKLLDNVHLVTQFPWVAGIMNALPKALLVKLNPEMRSVIDFDEEMTRQISHILDRSKPEDDSERMTVFRAILESHLPADELSLDRLHQEAMTLIGAGVETTRWALSVGSFHILSNPQILQRLQRTLNEAIPDPGNMPPLNELEQLPYLDACIQESLRMSYGVSQRAHRTSDHISIQYGPYKIPPGTIISMDNYAVSHDEQIFPDSYTFIPERWLNNPHAPDGKPLTAYMVSFGRGTRQCVGMPLALAEMYIMMANLFRKYEFELYKTDRSSVDCVKDSFAPRPKAGTLGVRVLVH